jgi:hypothetical protein
VTDDHLTDYRTACCGETVCRGCEPEDERPRCACGAPVYGARECELCAWDRACERMDAREIAEAAE